MIKKIFFIIFIIFFSIPVYALNVSSSVVQRESFSPIVEKVLPAVVNIRTTQIVRENPLMDFFDKDDPFYRFFKRYFGEIPHEYQQKSLGSGFIISSDGYILTNNHVISRATKIRVKLLYTGEVYDARVVGGDPKTDVALLKIKASRKLPTVALGDSDNIKVGDWVLAVGNPFGLNGTVTWGIISAKGRVIGQGPYDHFLQTDAAINPGNSGGPLVDMNGRVVGINTAIVASGQGIGFAVPINIAKKLIPQLKKGNIVRGWLGVLVQNVTPDMVKFFKLPDTSGAIVSQVVKGSPADRAGIKEGDVIVEYDGKKVNSATDLPYLVAFTTPGETVNIKIVRDGREIIKHVTIGKKPKKIALEREKESRLGITVTNITPYVKEEYNLKIDNGVVITDVREGSIAYLSGLKKGDVIIEVNRKKVKDVADFNEKIKKALKKKIILFLINRRGNQIYLSISVHE
ncbi:MAG: DegQ family serine endoprotease [Deltaproteobacteria bacterium]|nr:DegQ family serine endoprotease [Deltaproteobacteria bacterium]